MQEALHLPNSRIEAITRVPQIVTYAARNKEMEKKGGLWYCRTKIQALELLRLAKRHISGQSNVEQQRNQACIYSRYRVELV